MKRVGFILIGSLLLLFLLSCGQSPPQFQVSQSKMIVRIVEGRSWVYNVFSVSLDTLKYIPTDDPGPDGLGGWYTVWWASNNNDVEEGENYNPLIAKYTEEGVVYCLVSYDRGDYDIFGRKATKDTPRELLLKKKNKDLVYEPYLLAKYPIEVGETWNMGGIFSNLNMECISLNTDIDVTAGNFPTVAYRMINYEDEDSTYEMNFTPGIGLILYYWVHLGERRIFDELVEYY
ncbi:MAG: hypothetical protein JXR56_05450 [Candidatus Cloacimonetes bacterium]|nr:hypothetical protein [Candidatus Cloacimonadota bacterium]